MEAQQILLNLLRTIAAETEYADYKAVVEKGSASNFTSTLFHVKLSAAGKPDLKLFAKVAALPENLRTIFSPGPYSIELYFYKTLKNKFEKVEQKHSVLEEYRLPTPKVYGSSGEYLRETLVLEDLVAQGFQNFNKRHSADMEYMTAGIDMMARFHALSAAYYKDDSEGFKRAKESLAPDVSKMETFFMTTMYHRLLSHAYAEAGEHRAKLEKYFKEPNNFRQILNIFHSRNMNIIVHGDFKPSNLLHKRRNGKLEMAIVDFQLVHDGDPVAELLYFIFSATDEQFRRDHYQALLDLYYQRLNAALLRVNVDPELVYPEKTYNAHLEESKMLGLVMAVALFPALFAEEAPDFSEDEKYDYFIPKAGALFRERFNGVLNNYVEWGLL